MILSELNEIIVRAAKSNFLVNEAFAGDVYEVNAKENKFGCFVATPMTAIRNNSGSITYHYTMYYIDRLTKDEKNLDFVQSDAVTMLKSLINYFDVEEGFELETEYQFTLFRHQFDDWCAGAYVELDITVPDLDCEDYEYDVMVDLRPVTITENGVYRPIGFDGYNEVVVNVDTHEEDIKELEKEIEELEEQKSELERQKGELEKQVEELEGDVSELENQIGELNSQIGQLNDRIAELQSELERMSRTQTKTITENGTYTPDEGYYAFDQVEVDVAGGPLQTKNVAIGKEGLYALNFGEIEVTENGEYVPEGDVDAFSRIRVNVPQGSDVTEEWVDNEIDTKLEGYVKSEDLPDFTEFAKKTDIPEVPSLDGYATEEWVDEQGFLTEHQDLSEYAKLSGKNTFTSDTTFNEKVNFARNTYIDHYGYIYQQGAPVALKIDIPSLDGYATQDWVSQQGFISEYQVGSQGFAKKTDDNTYSGINKFEGTATYFGNYYSLSGRTYILQNGDIYDKGFKLENKYALKSDIPSFKTINGEEITGTGDIEIKGGADLPDYLKDGYIEITEEGNYTNISSGYIDFGSPEGFGASMNAWGMNSTSTDGSWSYIGSLELAGEQIGNGIQISNSEGSSYLTIMSDGISFWDFDQTTEEGEVDWENPTITNITKDDLISIAGLRVWTGTEAEWDALDEDEQVSYTIALIKE